jgi:hypothetical protein
MLAYTVGFGVFSVGCIYNDVDNHYNPIFIIEDTVCFALIFIGNLIYTFNLINSKIRTIWKFIFPIVILNFIIGLVIDSTFGKDSQVGGIALSVFAWVVAFILFLPTIRAQYTIGYGKETPADSV